MRSDATLGQVTLTLTMPPGRTWLGFFGAPANAAGTNIGIVWVDPATMFPFGSGMMGPSGSTSLTFQTPISLAGETFTAQMITYAQGIQQLRNEFAQGEHHQNEAGIELG